MRNAFEEITRCCLKPTQNAMANMSQNLVQFCSVISLCEG